MIWWEDPLDRSIQFSNGRSQAFMLIVQSNHTELLIEVKWLWSPANFKGVPKHAKIKLKFYVGKYTVVDRLFLHAHTLFLNQVFLTNKFLLFGFSDRSKHPLCLVHTQGKKVSICITNFVKLFNHSPLLILWSNTQLSRP